MLPEHADRFIIFLSSFVSAVGALTYIVFLRFF